MNMDTVNYMREIRQNGASITELADDPSFYRWNHETFMSAQVRKQISQVFRQYVASDKWNPLPLRAFLSEFNIRDLSDVVGNPDKKSDHESKLYNRLGTLTGWWNHRVPGPLNRKKLIEHGVLEARLANLDDNHRTDIYMSLLEKQKSVAIEYFNPEVVGEYADENRKGLIDSGLIKQYLQSEGVNLFNVNSSYTFHCRGRIGTITGWWSGQAGKSRADEIRRKLVENSAIEVKLANLPLDERNALCARMTKSPRSRPYLDVELVGDEIANENTTVFLSSTPFRKRQMINMPHPKDDSELGDVVTESNKIITQQIVEALENGQPFYFRDKTYVPVEGIRIVAKNTHSI